MDANLCTSKAPAPVRSKAIDLIKLIACVSVVCLHTVNPRLGPVHQWVYWLSGWAVPLFMMATGYFLFNRKEKPTQSYVVSKILGIFRFCCVWDVIFVLCTIGIVLIKEQDYLTAVCLLADYPADVLLCMMQDGTLGVLWYCGSLILLYLFAYAFYAKNMRAQRVWLYAFLCGFAFQLLSCVIQYPVQSLFRQTFLMWSWLQYAMLGAMIPRIVKKLRLSLPVHFLLMVLLLPVCVGFQIYCTENVLHTIYPMYFHDSISMIFSAALVFSFFLRLPEKAFSRINPTPLVVLSLGVFPVHIWVFRVLLHVPLPFLPQSEGLTNFIHFILTTILSFAAMYVVSRTRLKNYFLKL